MQTTVLLLCLVAAAMAGPAKFFRNQPRQLSRNQPQQSFTNQPQQSFRNQPQQSFRNQPQQSFNNQPQQSFNNQPQQSFNSQPQQSFNNQPQQVFNNQPVIGILRSEVEANGANFRNLFESEDGIAVEANGYEGSNGQSNMEGTYRFTLPDGSVAEVRWVADELGFRAESPLLPVAPPMPAHALEQIRFAEQQRAQGVQWNDQGFRIN